MHAYHAVLVAFLVCAPPVWGASQDEPFEVAAIKPSRNGGPQMVIRTSPSGLLTADSVNLQMLVRYAFDVPIVRIAGLPDWAVHDRFTITARGPAQATLMQFRSMVRALLLDRFSLQAHTDTRVMDVDVLTTTKADTLRPATPCLHGSERRNPCEMRLGFGRVVAVDSTLEDLANGLSTLTQRVVINETGRTDRLAFTLTYTPDAVALMTPEEAGRAFPQIDRSGPSLRTSLEDQLGLQMRTSRRAVPVLVVDRVSRPNMD